MTRPERSALRLGFLGVGWIGRHRMEAVCRDGLAVPAAVADVDPVGAAEAAAAVGCDRIVGDLDDLLALDLDGVVIATPSALHAEQTRRALAAGVAVFCQKPLGRTATEAASAVAAASERDLLLGVDLSYRHVEGVRRMASLVGEGALGDVYAARLVFHNAYGPDKAWFYDPAESGGGCVVDLGTHLVDLALHVLGRPAVEGVHARLFSAGRPLPGLGAGDVEDHAMATLDLATGAVVDLACSWNLPAGRDAVIEATFFGTRAAVSLQNVNGSFYDFRTELWEGTARRGLSEPPDEWGGRGVRRWAERLAAGGRFDPEVDSVVEVADVVDRIYGRKADPLRPVFDIRRGDATALDGREG